MAFGDPDAAEKKDKEKGFEIVRKPPPGGEDAKKYINDKGEKRVPLSDDYKSA